MKNFQVIKRNNNGTLRIEYLVPYYADIEVPTNSNGEELRGAQLINAINSIVLSLNTNTGEEIDPLISDELQLNTIEYNSFTNTIDVGSYTSDLE